MPIGTLYLISFSLATGLPILKCKDTDQYHHFIYNCKHMLQIFEISSKSEVSESAACGVEACPNFDIKF